MNRIADITIERGAILFDMDGVLVDSSPVIERSWLMWAKDRSLDGSQVLKLIHGRTAVETIKLLAPSLDPYEQWKILIAQELSDARGAPAYDGVSAILSKLPVRSWAIVTSAPRAIALSRLSQSSLPQPDVLVCAEDVQKGKPKPDCYLKAALDLNVEASQCLVIEDSLPGIEAARAAGMEVVGVATTHQRSDLLRANYSIDRISQMSVSANRGRIKVVLSCPK